MQCGLRHPLRGVPSALLYVPAMSDDASMSRDPLDPSIREELQQRLATAAGPGAIDCGFATEAASAEEVYRRASAALAARQPFYCIYSGRGLRPVAIKGYPPFQPVEHSAAGYVGRADGVVFEVRKYLRGPLTRGPDVLAPGGAASPRRLGLGMTIPIVVSSPTAALDGTAASIDGIVIVEAAIGIEGSVTDTRVLKPLPFGISDVAERLIRQSTFQPSRLFGAPIPVLFNIVVESRAGQLSVRPPVAEA